MGGSKNGGFLRKIAGFSGFLGGFLGGVRGVFSWVFYKNYQCIQEFRDDDVGLLSKNIKCF